MVVIDTGPDFREQALRNGLTRVDAVFYTHSHADHILGMDDLRPLSFTAVREGGPIPLYADAGDDRRCWSASTTTRFRRRPPIPPAPASQLEPLDERNPVHGVEFLRVPLHAWGDGDRRLSLWPRRLSDRRERHSRNRALRCSKALDHLVLSALRHKPHPSHATVEQAVAWARRIGARQTWLTHIAHELGHEETNRTLPDGIRLAYDGLSVPVNL